MHLRRLVGVCLFAFGMSTLALAQTLPDLRHWGDLTSPGPKVRVPAAALGPGCSLVVFGDGSFQTTVQLTMAGTFIQTDLGVFNEQTSSRKFYYDQHLEQLRSGRANDVLVELTRAIPAGKSVGVFTTSTNHGGALTEWMLSRVPQAIGRPAPPPQSPPPPSPSPGQPRVVAAGTMRGWPLFRIENPTVGSGQAVELVVGRIGSDGSGYGGTQPRSGETRPNVTEITQAMGGQGLILEINPGWRNDVISVRNVSGTFRSLTVWGIRQGGALVHLKSGTRQSYSLNELFAADATRASALTDVTHLIVALNLSGGSARQGGFGFVPTATQADVVFVRRN